VFLTRVPVGGFLYMPREWAWASAHFPMTGWLVGLATGLVFVGLEPVGALAAGILALGVSMMITGAFHEDGLADTSDALGGAFDRDKLRAILKDSRVGAFGAAALCVSIAGRAALFASLAGRPWLATVSGIAAVSAVARVGPVWQMVALPYATEQGSKSRDLTRAGWPQALVATGWGVLACAIAVSLGALGWERALVLVVVEVVITALTAYRYLVRLGGVAGDFLGATEQLCELAGLAVLAYGVT
jgi:adenosylcobinamide-GDP ribazoletransferase